MRGAKGGGSKSREGMGRSTGDRWAAKQGQGKVCVGGGGGNRGETPRGNTVGEHAATRVKVRCESHSGR